MKRTLFRILLAIALASPGFAQQVQETPQPKPKSEHKPRFGSFRWMAHHKKIVIPVAAAIGTGAIVGWKLNSGSGLDLYNGAFHCPSTGCVVTPPR